MIDEKDELNNKIEHDFQEDNETSIFYACSMCPAYFDEKSNLFINFMAIHEETRKIELRYL